MIQESPLLSIFMSDTKPLGGTSLTTNHSSLNGHQKRTHRKGRVSLPQGPKANNEKTQPVAPLGLPKSLRFSGAGELRVLHKRRNNTMTWLLIVYLAGLLYIASNHAKIRNKHDFRVAWIWFGLILVVHFVFAVCRAGNIRSPQNLVLIEVWSNGVSSLLLAISFFVLLGAMVPIDTSNAEPDAESDGVNAAD
jgi:hypothetical protein